ncbi:hypothetical protein PV08_11360 [Exophiala spinifera]|uniref:RING-type domain-containing protein n=1 Tax=Exophiala spinifera TaxID=91928 RepID=A0A0D2AUJ5_9EURO|nr:uncharacterized protein PV08_11360 [Exophiala spinifera]KIW10398.1 hypothetical protein PV08_11360 [Exophiala spinifera]
MSLFTQNAEALFPQLPSVITIDGYYIDKSGETDWTWFQKQTPMNGDDEGYELCRGIQNTRSLLDLLYRFADDRQPPPSKGYIAPGGQLTEDVRGNEALSHMFRHRVDLCQVLHSSNLLDTPTSQELTKTMQNGISEAEKAEFRLLQGLPQPHKEFHWLAEFERSLQECAYALFEAYRIARKHLSPSITKATRFVEKMYALVPPMTRLLVDLLLAEDAFEEAHARTHICDIKIEKRVKLTVDVPMNVAVMASQREQVRFHMGLLKQHAARYSTKIRDLYAYRYLVEWGHGRPWKQMYLVVDDTSGAGGVPKHIVDEFLIFATCTSPLASKMFNVRPMAFSDIDKEDICSICQEEYQVNDMVIELRHCRHRMHPDCVIEFWDNLHHYDNRCPMCRGQNPSIRELFPYFKAETKDVCYHADAEASHLATWLDRTIRHRLRRDLPTNCWEADLRRYFSTREVEAWLAGESFEQRLMSEDFFPQRRVEWDESSATTDGEEDEGYGGDENGNGNGYEGAQEEDEQRRDGDNGDEADSKDKDN